MRNYLLWILGILGIFWVVLFIVLFNKPKHEAWVDAKIPEETKEFFRNLAKQGGEINIEFIKKLIKKDFDNEGDIGNRQEAGFIKLEDEYFIVYYHRNDYEKRRADNTLRYAHEAVQPLTSLFGLYFSPNRINGRKLSIYLTDSRKDYDKVCIGLGEKAQGWSAGVTFMVFDDSGKSVCRGIVISDLVGKSGYNGIKETIWHEMAHFDHFSAMDITKKTIVLNWECEGIASFFAKEERKIDRSKIKSIQLDGQLENYLDSYWVGNSVYKYIDGKYRTRVVPTIIQSSFSKNMIECFNAVTDKSFKAFEYDSRRYYLHWLNGNEN